MRQSGAVLVKKDGVMGTSDLTTYQTGEKDSTSLKHGSTIEELNRELAELLRLYHKAGGKITGITLKQKISNWDTEHVLILPAVKIRDSYSLAPTEGIETKDV